LAALQAETWRNAISEGLPVNAVVDELVAATINFLGIKVKAVRVKTPQKVKGRPNLRRVA